MSNLQTKHLGFIVTERRYYYRRAFLVIDDKGRQRIVVNLDIGLVELFAAKDGTLRIDGNKRQRYDARLVSDYDVIEAWQTAYFALLDKVTQ